VKPLFTLHAGEVVVGEHIEHGYKNVEVWVPTKDTGVDLLIGYFCPTHRKGKIGALPEFRAHQLCLQRLSNIAVTGGNLLPGTVGSCRLDAVY